MKEDKETQQQEAIRRIDSAPDETPQRERLRLMKGALSVSRQEVEASLAGKEKGKRGRLPKSASGPSAPS